MRYKLLGSSGLRVSELFLGAMIFGDERGTGASVEDARAILDRYAEAGGNVVDTAVNYAGGRSEEILGELLGDARDRFVLATKYTVTRDGRDPNAGGNHRKNLTASLELSLRRLRTDRIDLYWVHIWDPHTPVDETVRALDDAVRAGKVLYVGISDAPAWVVARGNTLAEWRGWSPFVAMQIPYSLVQRECERELLPAAEAFGMSVAAWSPLGGGLLTGKYTSGGGAEGSARLAGQDLVPRDLSIARAVDEVAADLGASPAQVALAWTMARSPAIHPIIGCRRPAQLDDNLGALDVELPAEAMARLDACSAIERGFPHDFIAATAGWLYGPAGEQVVPRRH